jgi:hypothetical protein
MLQMKYCVGAMGRGESYGFGDHEQDGFDRLLSAAWKTHAAAEVQRWTIFTWIALAAVGYLWYC